MWPSQHPSGGAYNPAMLHLPSVQVALLAPRWLPGNFCPLWQRDFEKCLDLKKQRDVRKVASRPFFQLTFRHLASSAEQKTLILIWKCRQTGGETAVALETHRFRSESCTFCTLAAAEQQSISSCSAVNAHIHTVSFVLRKRSSQTVVMRSLSKSIFTSQ